MLAVFLNDVPVGEIRRSRGGRTEFRFLSSYLDLPDRPVLSQSFIDREEEPFVASVSHLPSFFRNLLPDPEGRHRDHVAHDLGVKVHQEFFMLARLGEDLSGAVRVTSDGEPGDLGAGEEADFPAAGGALAGTQPKFSAVQDGAAFRWSKAGRQSNFITKPPSLEHPGVTENEFSMMKWAAGAGLDVAEVSMVPIEQCKDLPDWLANQTGNALIVKRFDRVERRRVHIEDMAQAWGLEPDQKYERRHYAATANLLKALEDRAGFDDFIRRIVFMVASGNADGHLKNFSLIYDDPMRPRLAPAYDLVSTIQYPQYDNSGLALKLMDVKRWALITEDVFKQLAERLGEPPERLLALVRQTVGNIRDAWARMKADLPMLPAQKSTIEEHWQRVPLLR